MGFCENIGAQTIFQGENSNRKVFICKAGVGENGKTPDGQTINFCPYISIFSAREKCKSLKEPEFELVVEEERI